MIGKEKERGDLFMNKNLKRALNTTAAVSMSLAMVLGAVAPMNTTTVNAAYEVNDVVRDNKVFAALLDLLGEDYKLSTELDLVKTANDNPELVEYYTVKELLEKTNDVTLKVEGVDVEVAVKDFIANYISEYALTDKDAEYLEKAKMLKDFVAKVTDLNGKIGNGKDDKWAKKILDFLAKEEPELSEVRELEKEIRTTDGLETYINHVDAVEVDGETYEFVDLYNELVELADLDDEDLLDENVKAYQEKLLSLTIDNAITVKKVYEEELEAANLPVSKLKAVKGFVENIKNNKNATLKAIADFEDVEGEGDIPGIIDALDTLVENMEEAAELLSTKNEVYKDYKDAKGATVVNDLVDAGKNFNKKLGEIKTDVLEAVSAYYEEVVSQFVTQDVEQRTSGSYRVNKGYTELAPHMAADDQFKGFQDLMVLIDKEEETTKLDAVVKRAGDVQTAVDAISKDLKGVTVNNIASNVKAIKAAEDALAKLVAGEDIFADDNNAAEYSNNLTNSQKKTVKANYKNAQMLVDKMYEGGYSAMTTGWVETAQGWEYYDNSGKRVMEGWAAGNGYWSFMKNGYSVSNEWCAAKDGWYYMGADGKMVTGKVVIDGVEQDFGTDGIWVR